jgi:spermidine synthase
VQVASVQSVFQKIDVVDFYDKDSFATLKDGLKKDKDYVLKHPKFFEPDRTLFLDGVVQSTRDGNAAYHESLVQPSMFAHENPKRVAIVGGGECATLREVLKHNTLEKVIMIEIDEVIVEASKQFLPDWNDCSNFEGSSRYCMDDARAEVFNEDAFKWFIDRFGANPSEEEPPFDVIILDAL